MSRRFRAELIAITLSSPRSTPHRVVRPLPRRIAPGGWGSCSGPGPQ